jgi:hypothetical protein
MHFAFLLAGTNNKPKHPKIDMAAGGQSSIPGVFQVLLDHLQFIYEEFKGILL